jgi:CDP-diacylglycerol--glycerol-3-phosphate 3-phosphatidyltransferase
MTLATKITFIRVVAIPIFMVSFFWNGENLQADWGKISATVVFLIGAISDYYDGAVARYYKEETTFGKFMDPIADKLLVSTALIAMVEYRSITFVPAWMAIVIIAREFCVSGLRLVCAPKGNVIEASRLGKWKTAFQLAAIITALVFVSFRILIETYQWKEAGAWFLPHHGHIITGMFSITVILTLYSGYDYLRNNWHLLTE